LDALTETLHLFSGAGESGKSTIMKQMRIIHSGGFAVDERRHTRAIIYSNLIIAFKVLVDIMQAQNIEFENATSKVKHTNFIEKGSCLFPAL
jgi:guanine nucleotide-binding protein subunit alpha